MKFSHICSSEVRAVEDYEAVATLAIACLHVGGICSLMWVKPHNLVSAYLAAFLAERLISMLVPEAGTPTSPVRPLVSGASANELAICAHGFSPNRASLSACRPKTFGIGSVISSSLSSRGGRRHSEILMEV
jgi:hypothetical protein